MSAETIILTAYALCFILIGAGIGVGVTLWLMQKECFTRNEMLAFGDNCMRVGRFSSNPFLEIDDDDLTNWDNHRKPSMP